MRFSSWTFLLVVFLVIYVLSDGDNTHALIGFWACMILDNIETREGA